MLKLKSASVLALMITLLSSCEAIGNIFKAGVWIGMAAVIAVIIILMLIFRKKS